MRKAEQNLTGYTLRKLLAIRPGNTAGSHQESFIRKAHRRSFAAVKAMKMRDYPESAAEKTPPRSDQTGATFFHQKQKGKDF